MRTYQDQHTPWRPDYPPVWNARTEHFSVDFKRKPCSKIDVWRNTTAFTTARNAIDKAMKQ